MYHRPTVGHPWSRPLVTVDDLVQHTRSYKKEENITSMPIDDTLKMQYAHNDTAFK